MMKRHFLMMVSLMALVAATMMSCMSVNLGNGGKDDTPTQVPNLNQVTMMQPFDEVEIGGAFKVIYEQSQSHSVRIEASEQALKEMTVYVKDDELHIRQAVNKPTVSFSDVKVYVASPSIQHIEIAGSGIFTASKPIKTIDLHAEVAGSGKILLVAVNGQNTDLEIAGSGDIEIGQLDCNTIRAQIAGSGNVNLEALNCKDFNIEIAGSGNVACQHIDADNVHTEIAGSGDVNLKGTVRHSTKDIAGSGKVVITE